MDLFKINNKLIKIIKEAGKVAIELLNNGNIHEEKSKANFLTFIDLKIQELLFDSLRMILPESKFISEEIENNEEISNGYYWVIDPIDGTTNLMHQYPHFSTSVALVSDKKPVIAVTYNILTDELFNAQAGKGANLNGKPIKISMISELRNSLLGFGFPYDRSKISHLLALIKETILLTQDLRRTGSASLDMAYVACGRIDGFYEFDLEVWDYCAGSLLITEAGGTISDWQNRPLNFTDKINIAASNGLIHKELIEIINKVNNAKH